MKKIEYVCNKNCYDGWIPVRDENGHERMTECECRAIQAAIRHMRNSGIAEEFQNLSFENYATYDNKQVSEAKEMAMKYVERFEEHHTERQNSIMFMGQVGAGKTHLGIAICAELINKGVPVIYMPYRNAVTGLKQHMIDEDFYNREIEKYSKAAVLYIDDFLKGKLSETDVNIMYEIINYRYMNNLPMIISTEKSLEGLLKFDEAVGSRLIEMSRNFVVTFRGSNLNYRIYGGRAS